MERFSGGPSLRASDGDRSNSHSPRLPGRTSSPALVIDLSVPDVVDLTQDSPELPRKRRRSQSRGVLGLNQLHQSDQVRRRKPRSKRLCSCAEFREERKRSLCRPVDCMIGDENCVLDLSEECSSPSPDLPDCADLPSGRCDRTFLGRNHVDDSLEIVSPPAVVSAVNRCWTTQGAYSSAISIPDENSSGASEGPRRLGKSTPPPLHSNTLQSGSAQRGLRPCKRRCNKRLTFRSPAASLSVSGTATSLGARSSHGSSPPHSHLGHNCADVDEAADELLARALQRIYEEEDGLPTYTPLPLVDSAPLSLALSRYTDSAAHTTQAYSNTIASWPYEALLSLTDRLGTARKLGMTQTAIRALPTVYYQRSDDSPRQDTCVICLSEFQIGDQLRQLPCAHRFHRKCVDNWLSKNKACPICRSSAATSRTLND